MKKFRLSINKFPAAGCREKYLSANTLKKYGFILNSLLLFAFACLFMFYNANSADCAEFFKKNRDAKFIRPEKPDKIEFVERSEKLSILKAASEPLEDSYDYLTIIKLTDECVKKLGGRPDTEMIKDVCDYLLRCDAGAIGVEFLFETPTLYDRGFEKLLRRSKKIVLASEVELDANVYYKNWVEASRDFKLTLAYAALDETAARTGYVNFDASSGFEKLRCFTFFLRAKEVFLSMPLALIFVREGVETFDVISSRGEYSGSKYDICFKHLQVAQVFMPYCRFRFKYEKFSDLLARARRFLASPNPEALSMAYRSKIVLIGDDTADAKVYIKSRGAVRNIDVLASSIVEMYKLFRWKRCE